MANIIFDLGCGIDAITILIVIVISIGILAIQPIPRTLTTWVVRLVLIGLPVTGVVAINEWVGRAAGVLLGALAALGLGWAILCFRHPKVGDHTSKALKFSWKHGLRVTKLVAITAFDTGFVVWEKKYHLSKFVKSIHLPVRLPKALKGVYRTPLPRLVVARDKTFGLFSEKSVGTNLLYLGATQSGKTTGALPLATSHPGPLFLSLAKADPVQAVLSHRDVERTWILDLRTAAARSGWKVEGQRFVCNPVAEAAKQPDDHVWEASVEIAQSLGSASPAARESSIWQREAPAILAAIVFVAVMAVKNGEPADLEWVLDMAAPERLPEVDAVLFRHPEWDQSATRAMAGVRNVRGDMVKDFSASVNDISRTIAGPILKALCGSPFDWDSFLRSRSTLLVLMSTTQMDDPLAALPTLMLSTLLSAADRVDRQRGNGLPHALLLFLDEIGAAWPAKFVKLPGLLADCGGKGVRCICIAQDRNQLVERWGELAGSIWANCTTRIFFSPPDHELAVEMSAGSGTKTKSISHGDQKQLIQVPRIAVEDLVRFKGKRTVLIDRVNQHVWWGRALKPVVERKHKDKNDFVT